VIVELCCKQAGPQSQKGINRLAHGRTHIQVGNVTQSQCSKSRWAGSTLLAVYCEDCEQRLESCLLLWLIREFCRGALSGLPLGFTTPSLELIYASILRSGNRIKVSSPYSMASFLAMVLAHIVVIHNTGNGPVFETTTCNARRTLDFYWLLPYTNKLNLPRSWKTLLPGSAILNSSNWMRQSLIYCIFILTRGELTWWSLLVSWMISIDTSDKILPIPTAIKVQLTVQHRRRHCLADIRWGEVGWLQATGRDLSKGWRVITCIFPSPLYIDLNTCLGQRVLYRAWLRW